MPSVRPGSTPNTDKDAEHGCGRSEAIFSLKTIGGHAPADILAIRKAPAARRTAVALAHQLALKTSSTTKTFLRPETFNLVDQMRRAASGTA